MEQRKSDHIRMALQSQMSPDEQDRRFHYEPLLQSHPINDLPPFDFLGKKLKIPLWVSSMTGGTEGAYRINHNLARACREFGMGMGLGSCRSILYDNKYLPDFNVRNIMGDELPLYANLGIVQVEQMVKEGKIKLINEMVQKLQADGLIVHVNPLQEWFQPEGDHLQEAPLNTIKRFIEVAQYPVIVKEVGQGMGPASLKELFKLPLAAVELAAFGGTNFARVELLRSSAEKHFLYEPYTRIGETAHDMVLYINEIATNHSVSVRQVILSGGIRNFLDGYYLLRKINIPAIYGQASGFLLHAREDYENLQKYCSDQVEGLKLAYSYLTVK